MFRNKSFEGMPNSEGSDGGQENKARSRRCCRCCTCKCCSIATAVTVVVVFVVLLAVYFGFGYPIHASCSINWTFPQNCSSVNTSLIAQMEKWTSRDNCPDGGQKCLYTFISSSSTELKGTHTTPVHGYVDDMTFTFMDPQDSPTCNVKAFSTSRVWYAYLDFGTNYCNLRNLAEGAGLTSRSNFTEVTRDSICTQYTSRNCEVY
ncbi:uncharacterized protein LOC144910495 [Branchiostoma floridae x Branchiostoma belcheri]